MVTILKFPIYVELTTDNGVDRRMLTEMSNSILYPELLRYLGNAKYRSNIILKMKEVSGIHNLEVQLLTEIELLQDRIHKGKKPDDSDL